MHTSYSIVISMKNEMEMQNTPDNPKIEKWTPPINIERKVSSAILGEPILIRNKVNPTFGIMVSVNVSSGEVYGARYPPL